MHGVRKLIIESPRRLGLPNVNHSHLIEAPVLAYELRRLFFVRSHSPSLSSARNTRHSAPVGTVTPRCVRDSKFSGRETERGTRLDISPPHYLETGLSIFLLLTESSI